MKFYLKAFLLVGATIGLVAHFVTFRDLVSLVMSV